MPTDGVYLHLFHGRKDPAENLDDWGSDGPVIGPLRYVHVTYMCDVKFGCSPEVFRQFWPEKAAEYDAKGVSNLKGEVVDGWMTLHGDLLEHDGVFYGDWSVSDTAPKAVDFNAD